MSFKVGDRVSTPLFGCGIIVKIEYCDHLVRHDNTDPALHNGGLGDDNHCHWWYGSEDLNYESEGEILQ